MYKYNKNLVNIGIQTNYRTLYKSMQMKWKLFETKWRIGRGIKYVQFGHQDARNDLIQKKHNELYVEKSFSKQYVNKYFRVSVSSLKTNLIHIYSSRI